RNTNRWPLCGLRLSVSCTSSANPSKPLRISVWPVASHTRAPAGIGIVISARWRRSGAPARRHRRPYPQGHGRRPPARSPSGLLDLTPASPPPHHTRGVARRPPAPNPRLGKRDAILVAAQSPFASQAPPMEQLARQQSVSSRGRRDLPRAALAFRNDPALLL